MNKALCITAAVALALSSSAFARGGGAKHGAKAQSSTAAEAQISLSDCSALSVESARNECMRHARANGSISSDSAVGATAGSAGGSVEGSASASASADPAGSADNQTSGKVSD
ncbi:MAG TPA: hypothetical protein VED01_12985 [Burkholderiales bacterium]|nr:hypothetical protein [Burkholderiales bacterium]